MLESDRMHGVVHNYPSACLYELTGASAARDGEEGGRTA